MELRGKSLFLTGGGGFIGSHLCERLVETNRITVYDDGTRDALRYTRLLGHPNLTLVRGSVLDRELLARSARGAEVIVHLAAVAGVSNYFRRPVDTMRTNFIGTSNVLEVAREVEPQLFVNVSTSEVYGPRATDAREAENTSQGEVRVSRWTYSVSKLAGEHLCFAYHRQFGLPVVSIRPFNVYGARQVGEGAVQIFAPLALRGEPITVHDDGAQTRAWCHVDDLVDGFLLAAGSEKAVGETFNLGNPQETVTVLTLARMVIACCRSRSEIVFAPFPPDGEVRERSPNVEKAASVLGFRPRVSLQEGLERTVAWYRDEYRP